METETLQKTDNVHTIELDNIEAPPHYHPEQGPQIVTSDTARAGPLGQPVFIVLMISLAAIVVGFELVAWFMK